MRSLVLGLLAIAACSAPAGPPPPAASPGSASGAPGPGSRATFVLASAMGLIALDDRCASLGHVAELPDQTYTATLGLAPARDRVAFNLTSATNGGFGSDIYEVKLDGSGLHPLVAREAASVFYDSPRYDPSGAALYVHRRSPIVTNGAQTGLDDTIERVDLATGARRALVRDGEGPTIAPDGRRMVYVHLKDGFPDALWTASLPDAADAHPLLRTPDTFVYLQTPQLSPSGVEVVFSAAGHRTSALPAGGRLAHLGIPSQLYVAPSDGSRVVQLAETMDDVVPAWSPDGSRIAYVGAGTFAVLTPADRAASVCGRGNAFLSGSIVWVR